MTKATQDGLMATAAAQPDPPEPTVPAGTAVPRMASARKADKKLPCKEVDYALYCCIQRANGHLDCFIR
jgi:hypothetical protein